MEYLTVKDVAALVCRNEETIRRMIRRQKLNVQLDNNNRKQGYMIPVWQLLENWDVSREDVAHYIEQRRNETENGDESGPGAAQIGQEPPKCASQLAQRANETHAEQVMRAAELAKDAHAYSEDIARDAYTRSSDSHAFSRAQNQGTNAAELVPETRPHDADTAHDAYAPHDADARSYEEKLSLLETQVERLSQQIELLTTKLMGKNQGE